MKKIIIVMTIAMLTLFGKAYAEVTFGVSAAITKISADGTETEGGEKTNGSASNDVVIPSIFAEYSNLSGAGAAASSQTTGEGVVAVGTSVSF